MAIAIAPYTEKHIPAVVAFNRRLQAGGAPPDYVFPESHISEWLPHESGSPLYNQFYLALEEETVRGTFALKHQQFSFFGEVRPVVFYHHPFSEGIIDKKYAQVGLRMLMHVVRAHPWVYALGMGGYDRPLPRMLVAMKWNHCAIPFYFRVSHPFRFLREMRAMRQSGILRISADIAAYSGAGWFGLKTIHAVKSFARMRQREEAEVVPDFGPWVDQIWDKCAPLFAMIAVRDACSLRTIYPASNKDFMRLRIRSGSRTVGWAVVADMQKKNHPQFGDLRVGTILDGLACPGDATSVVSAATRMLINRGVDVVTSNQSHRAWMQALEQCGYLKGPSNFIFATSVELSGLLQPFESSVRHSHITRSDGDNLLQYV